MPLIDYDSDDTPELIYDDDMPELIYDSDDMPELIYEYDSDATVYESIHIIDTQLANSPYP